MDTKKLEKWADLLLNTNKNNRFLNVDDNSTSVADILLPAANELFGKIAYICIFYQRIFPGKRRFYYGRALFPWNHDRNNRCHIIS